MHESIGIVVLHYKSWENTIACINSLLAIDSFDLVINIVVVDNFSNDGSGERIQHFISEKNIEIDFLTTKENMGFARGNNFGAAFLQKKYSCDFIICTNNDISIEDKRFYHKIIAEYNESKFDILGPDVYSITEGIHQNPMEATSWNRFKITRKIINLKAKYFVLIAIKKLHLKSRFKVSDGKRTDSDYKIRKTGVQLNGSIVVFSAKYIRKTGYCFYPETFLYMEEDILFEIIKRYGFKSVYNPELKVLHNHSAATKNEVSDSFDRKIFRIKNVLNSLEVFDKLLKGNGKNEHNKV